MKKWYRSIGLITCLMMFVILLSSCFNREVSIIDPKKYSKDGPFGKFNESVTLTAVKVLPTFCKFKQGEDIENNIWTRTIEEKLNIKLKYVWTSPNWGEPYDQKINIAFASNDIPDIMPLYTSLFMKAVDGQVMSDLTDSYNKYGSDRLKKLLNSTNGVAIKNATFNGKLLAIAQPGKVENGDLIWIRQDWMNKLGLAEPKTMDDLLNIARAFAKNDPDGNGKNDTYGIAVNNNLAGGNGSLGGFFAGYGIYPGTWVEKDGKLVKSDTLPEIREPLKVLAALYKEGVIHKDFALKDASKEVKQDIIAGKVGLTYGGGNLPEDALKEVNKRSGADWKCYTPVSATEKPVTVIVGSNIGGFNAAGNKCKNPDAFIKLTNFILETVDGTPDWVKPGSEFMKTTEGYPANFYAPFIIRDNNDESKIQQLVNAIQKDDPSGLNSEYGVIYKKVKGYQNKTPEGDWSAYKIYNPDGAARLNMTFKEQGHVLPSKAYYNETPAWVENGGTLYSKSKEFMIKAIITGDVDNAYNDYLNAFNTQGGAKATEEINQLYQQDKK